jgi:hypothetical protein
LKHFDKPEGLAFELNDTLAGVQGRTGGDRADLSNNKAHERQAQNAQEVCKTSGKKKGYLRRLQNHALMRERLPTPGLHRVRVFDGKGRTKKNSKPAAKRTGRGRVQQQ